MTRRADDKASRGAQLEHVAARGQRDGSRLRQSLREETGLAFDAVWDLEGLSLPLNEFWLLTLEPVDGEGPQEQMVLPRKSVPVLTPGSMIRAPRSDGAPVREWRVVEAVTGEQEVPASIRLPDGEELETTMVWKEVMAPPPPPVAWVPLLAGAALEGASQAEKQSRDSSHAGKRRRDQRRTVADAVLRAVEKIRADLPPRARTWKKAAARYLEQTDPSWWIGPDDERKNKQRALLRRLRRARRRRSGKKDGR